jgi:hypothetical protein
VAAQVFVRGKPHPRTIGRKDPCNDHFGRQIVDDEYVATAGLPADHVAHVQATVGGDRCRKHDLVAARLGQATLLHLQTEELQENR